MTTTYTESQKIIHSEQGIYVAGRNVLYRQKLMEGMSNCLKESDKSENDFWCDSCPLRGDCYSVLKSIEKEQK